MDRAIDTSSAPAWQKTLRTWGFLAIPAAALLELFAHEVQTHTVVSDDDWRAARDVVKAEAKPDDLVVFAPRWTDPVGRHVFGDEIATLEREAPSDASRFPRAFEVSIRGGHEADLLGWKKLSEKKTGGVTITTLENPSYLKTLDDLVDHIDGEHARVTSMHDDEESPCTWVAGAGAQTGNLGFGPALPNRRYACPSGTMVGVSVVADLGYRAHRCIYAPPRGSGTVTRIHFGDVLFGEVLHGHHGLYVEAERNREGAPVSLAFSVGEKKIGKVTHLDGEGWKGFDLPTGELAGQRGELVADVSAPNGNRRMYCFEAITR